MKAQCNVKSSNMGILIAKACWVDTLKASFFRLSSSLSLLSSSSSAAAASLLLSSSLLLLSSSLSSATFRVDISDHGSPLHSVTCQGHKIVIANGVCVPFHKVSFPLKPLLTSPDQNLIESLCLAISPSPCSLFSAQICSKYVVINTRIPASKLICDHLLVLYMLKF